MSSDPWQDKLRRIDAPAVAPLNALVRAWRSTEAANSIPWFDPDDSGIHARLLLLVESPAPRTVSANGSGFCSLDNPDRSNQRLTKLLREKGISRSDCVKWNMVPCALRDEVGRPRPPRRRDLDLAAPRLREVLDLTRNLDVVLTLGSASLSGYMLAVTAEPPTTLHRVLAAPHPSQRNAASSALSVRRIENALGAIATHLNAE
jgi:uracil-DNA glycosylase